MELLLIEDVPGLGSRGEIVNVARGYARNYLLPRKLARKPDEQAIAEVRRKAARIAAELEALKAEKMAEAKTLATAAVSIAMKAGKEGHLYGSVGAKQIAEALVAAGHGVEEKQVHLDQPLKDVGEYDVTIALHPEVLVPVKVAVIPEED